MPDITAHCCDAADELAARKEGCGELVWDPHTAESPHETSYEYCCGEPVTNVQMTYEGRPVWICANCARMAIANADSVDTLPCRHCGAVGDLMSALLPDPCEDEGHTG